MELPETGSRGGAVFIKDGEAVKEDLHFRDYLTVTKGGKVEYVKTSPVPCEQKSFEYYLKG